MGKSEMRKSIRQSMVVGVTVVRWFGVSVVQCVRMKRKYRIFLQFDHLSHGRAATVPSISLLRLHAHISSGNV